MRYMIGALVVALLTGCSTSPVSSTDAVRVPADRVSGYQAPLKNGSTLVVTRDTGWMAGGGCYVAVLIDGRVVARVDTGETASFNIPPGRHLIGMSGDAEGGGLCAAQVAQSLKESGLEIRAGEIQKFRISGDTRGLDLRPTSL